MKDIFAVAIGGALGSVLRHILAGHLSILSVSLFTPIILINALGCFIMGFVVKYIPANNCYLPLIKTGFLGALTTFSTFTNEAFTAYDKDGTTKFITYIAVTFILCMASYLLGTIIAERAS